MNRYIKLILKELKVHLFDFENVFTRDKRYYNEGVHVTVEGASLKSKLIADYIMQQELLPTRNKPVIVDDRADTFYP